MAWSLRMCWNKVWRTLFCWIVVLLIIQGGGAEAAPGLVPAGHVGGAGRCIAVKDHYAYYDRGTTVEIYDLADPARPKPVGTLKTGFMKDFQIYGNRGFLWPEMSDQYARLLIYDLSHPATPVLLAPVRGIYYPGITMPLSLLSLNNLFVSGGFLYCAYGYGIIVCNMADLNHLQIVGAYVQPGSKGGIIAPAGKSACFLRDGKIFETLNIAGSTTPTLQGRLDLATSTSETSVLRMHTAGNMALVADDRKLHIIDISTPARPVLLSELALPYAAVRTGKTDWDFVTSGTKAYLYGKFPLNTIDFSNARVPKLLPEQKFKVDALDLFGKLCVCREGGYLTMRNLVGATPETPVGRTGVDLTACTDVEVGPITHVGYKSYAYLFASDGVSLFSYTFSPDNPVQLGRLDGIYGKLSRGLIGGTTYLFCSGNNFKIINVNNPRAMSVMGQCTVPNGESRHKGVLMGTRFYIQSGIRQVSIVDVSNPKAPKVSGVINFQVTFPRIDDFAIRGNLAYVLGHEDGVYIYDISTPAKPTLMGKCDVFTPFTERQFSLNGHYLYFYLGVLSILDVSNPKNPVGVYKGMADAASRPRGVQRGSDSWLPYLVRTRVDGKLAFQISKCWYGNFLDIYDLSDPAHSVQLISTESPMEWPVNELVYWQNHLYLASEDAGLWVLKLGIKDPNCAAEAGWGRYR